ncbi:PEP-CTERM sorting domain-containing protein [Symmachiella dynata]|uniref:PEP-CTERM sorting domain-containing protein n=1 Tax=Symmachiella dynata TaxID=2527995 RepID=UPI0030EE19B6
MKQIFIAGLISLSLATSAQAGLVLHDSGYEHFLRSNFQAFPIAVDSSGLIHVVTSTSTSADLRRVNLNNSVTTLNSSVGAIIGINADLEFGFGGDLFANAQGAIRRFSMPGGAGSNFVTGSMSHTGGLAYDPISGLLWVTYGVGNDTFIESYNSSGTMIDFFSYVGVGSPNGLTADSSGDLLLINYDENAGIRRIDTGTGTAQLLTDFSSSTLSPVNGIVTDNAGDIFFTGDLNGGTGVYRVDSTGSNLNLIASNPISGFNIAIGPSGDGSGTQSIYLTSPHVHEINELRPVAVPEPSSIVLLGVGGIALVAAGWRRKRQ